MPKASWLCVGAVLAILAVEVTAQQTPAAKPPAKPAATTTAATTAAPATKPAATATTPPPRFVGSVRDIMHVLVEPNADKLFDSVAVEVNDKGIHERKPENDEQWDELEHAAIAMAEAVNLIKMVGRPMAQPGEMNQDPEGPELAPVQIAARVNRTRAQWNKYADRLQNEAVKALAIIKKKDAKALFDMGGDLDEACENCHLEYWYPEDKKPRK